MVERARFSKLGQQLELVVDINRHMPGSDQLDAADGGASRFFRGPPHAHRAGFGPDTLRETFWTYWKIYETYPNGKLAYSCYRAFALAAQLRAGRQVSRLSEGNSRRFQKESSGKMSVSS